MERALTPSYCDENTLKQLWSCPTGANSAALVGPKYDYILKYVSLSSHSRGLAALMAGGL